MSYYLIGAPPCSWFPVGFSFLYACEFFRFSLDEFFIFFKIKVKIRQNTIVMTQAMRTPDAGKLLKFNLLSPEAGEVGTAEVVLCLDLISNGCWGKWPTLLPL
ncbi:hypothetical protein SDJN02_18518 [Cucurbita argyrosperma subsp. argyrosperma]|nr:hypothetical protein SDJN02_18518 [Cucurbita argyrosperma subsp. argyrosperma]